MPRIRVRFHDGEVMDMFSEGLDASRDAFLGVPEGGTNNRKAWVALSAVKYITFPDLDLPDIIRDQEHADRRLILRFTDGETVRAFADDSFGVDGKAFNVRLWDSNTGTVARTLVPHHSLKAIFFVEVWDSRTEPAVARG